MGAVVEQVVESILRLAPALETPAVIPVRVALAVTVMTAGVAEPTATLPISTEEGEKLKFPGRVATPVTAMVTTLLPVAATDTLPEIAPATIGVAVMDRLQDALIAKVVGHPVAVKSFWTTVSVAWAVPVLVIFTTTGVEVLPTSTLPTETLTLSALS
jgi:hypothetical protein